MYLLLISLVIGLFIAIVFVNVYFRIKVLKTYKFLVQNRVQFDAKDVFDMKHIEEVVIPKYPEHAEQIRLFIHNIRYSVRMAILLIALITLFGWILIYYR